MKGKAIIIAGAALFIGAAAWWTMSPRGPRPADLTTEATEVLPAKGSAALPQAPPEAPQTNAQGPANVEHWPDREPVRLTPEQAEAYVQQNHRNLTSLLAASRASGDKSYLREAMERFPNDPRVAFDAYFLNGPYDNKAPATPERRQWLDSFRQNAPDNALPDYLAAVDHFKAGRTDLALQELQAAAGKPRFDAYLMDSLQATEEAYRSAGYSEGDAKSSAAWGLLLPHLSETRQLAQNLADLASQYQKAGDTPAVQSILQMGLSLGDKVSGEFPLLNTLVGIADQKKVLAVMDPASPYLDTGMTVQDQIDALNQDRDSIKALASQTEQVLPRLSEADRISFYDRLRIFGERAAVRWAMEKYGMQ